MRLVPLVLLVALLPWLAAPQEADSERGRVVWEQCVACHALDEGESGDLGPSLAGVFGREAGTREDFRYSGPMRRSGITWDAATLDAFLAAPQEVVPNNRMPFEGIVDAQARRDLVAFLEERTHPAPE